MTKLQRFGKPTLAGSVVVLAYLLVLKIQVGTGFTEAVSIPSAIFLFAVFFFIGYSVNGDKENQEIAEKEKRGDGK